jgi:hypothetical protein
VLFFSTTCHRFSSVSICWPTGSPQVQRGDVRPQFIFRLFRKRGQSFADGQQEPFIEFVEPRPVGLQQALGKGRHVPRVVQRNEASVQSCGLQWFGARPLDQPAAPGPQRRRRPSPSPSLSRNPSVHRIIKTKKKLGPDQRFPAKDGLSMTPAFTRVSGGRNETNPDPSYFPQSSVSYLHTRTPYS